MHMSCINVRMFETLYFSIQTLLLMLCSYTPERPQGTNACILGGVYSTERNDQPNIIRTFKRMFKLQNPVILEYCSKVMGRELWKDVLYFLE